MTKKKSDSKKILVTQVRSTIGHRKGQCRTLESLGLGSIGQRKEHRAEPSILGMVKTVRHLVAVTDLRDSDVKE